ncbi:cytidine deaminase [bacterium]|nr:cytidine deaminase [bacterium]
MKELNFNQLNEIEKNLINEAINIKSYSYSPYSNYPVGAALLDKNDAIHTGCNVESADYTLSTHAEMVAINSMVKSGVHKLKIMVVVVESKTGYGMPCGLCRQKIREFAKDLDIPVYGINVTPENKISKIYCAPLKELLPWSFDVEVLNN